jgi:hypothetical protein
MRDAEPGSARRKPHARCRRTPAAASATSAAPRTRIQRTHALRPATEMTAARRLHVEWPSGSWIGCQLHQTAVTLMAAVATNTSATNHALARSHGCGDRTAASPRASGDVLSWLTVHAPRRRDRYHGRAVSHPDRYPWRRVTCACRRRAARLRVRSWNRGAGRRSRPTQRLADRRCLRRGVRSLRPNPTPSLNGHASDGARSAAGGSAPGCLRAGRAARRAPWRSPVRDRRAW